MVDDKSIVDDFTDEDLTLVSIHSSSSSESEGDVLEGNNSLENSSNSGDHTNDTIEDEMTTTTFASSFQSTPLLSNNNHTNDNHTNDAMEDAKTRTEHSSTSQVDLAHQ